MLNTSPAIEQVKSKIIYIRKGNGIMAISDGKTKEGKWHIIDMCFGTYNQAIRDLKAEGYTIKTF
jgi:hypothetical protein